MTTPIQERFGSCQKFIVTVSDVFDKGDILTLEDDDNTRCPLFKNIITGQTGFEALIYIEPYQEIKQFDIIDVRNASGAWMIGQRRFLADVSKEEGSVSIYPIKTVALNYAYAYCYSEMRRHVPKPDIKLTINGEEVALSDETVQQISELAGKSQ